MNIPKGYKVISEEQFDKVLADMGKPFKFETAGFVLKTSDPARKCCPNSLANRK